MTVDKIETILAGHMLGFMGRCVTDVGAQGCPWRAKRSDIHGNYGTQHRTHVAELIAAAVAA